MTDETKPDPQEPVPPVEDAAEPEETFLDDSPDEEAEAAVLSSEAREFHGDVIESETGESDDTGPGSVALARSRPSPADDNGARDTDRVVSESQASVQYSSRW